MTRLKELRQQLKEINLDLFQVLAKRKSVTKAIQDQKKIDKHQTYDAKRELDLFLSLQGELSHLSPKELFAFSLLMESHAGEGYPEWSSTEHLSTKQSTLYDQINPLLLLLFYPHEIKVKALKSEFKFLSDILKERDERQSHRH